MEIKKNSQFQTGIKPGTFLTLEGCGSHSDSYFSICVLIPSNFGSFLAKWTPKLPMFGIMTCT